ncbi:unnamed protein product [Pleuronectes platessa]|uniref:Uncharacterized protein n=1 Tax=Pleuronectes platessa TaxID=8262 RepID=A0A9N7TRK4_PLEPL|nr:unnamed protein product [Pleuronectes platessa]
MSVQLKTLGHIPSYQERLLTTHPPWPVLAEMNQSGWAVAISLPLKTAANRSSGSRREKAAWETGLKFTEEKKASKATLQPVPTEPLPRAAVRHQQTLCISLLCVHGQDLRTKSSVATTTLRIICVHMRREGGGPCSCRPSTAEGYVRAGVTGMMRCSGGEMVSNVVAPECGGDAMFVRGFEDYIRKDECFPSHTSPVTHSFSSLSEQNALSTWQFKSAHSAGSRRGARLSSPGERAHKALGSCVCAATAERGDAREERLLSCCSRGIASRRGAALRLDAGAHGEKLNTQRKDAEPSGSRSCSLTSSAQHRSSVLL